MIRFEGQLEIVQTPAVVWNHLGNANFIVQCIPYVHKVTVTGTDEAQINVRPGFSFLQGSLDVHVKIALRTPNNFVKVILDSKGIGTSSTVEIVLNIEEISTGSRLHWTSEVTKMGGLLNLVPVGLIQAAADKVIQIAVQDLTNKLNAIPSPSKT